MYQFSSASANNGSAFDGLGVSYGLNDNASPSPEAVPFDIAAGIVIVISRFLPIIAPIAMAGYLGAKNRRRSVWEPCAMIRQPSASSCWV